MLKELIEIFKPKIGTLVQICVVKEQHKNHWCQAGDSHLLYKHDGFYANVDSLENSVCGGAKIIMAHHVVEV